MDLWQPLQVAHRTLRNRIVFPPVVTNLASGGGEVTDDLLTHYRRIAAGGAGLVIVEATYIHPSSRAFPFGLGADHPDKLPGLRRLAQAIKKEGALPGIQLFHPGARANPNLAGVVGVGPSSITLMPNLPSQALTKDEIRDLTKTFGDAVELAVKAGFELICLHMAHGFLLSEFLSPLANRRRDEYGGSLENRLRFPLAVLEEALRRAPKAIISCRISAHEGEGGITPAEAAQIAQALSAHAHIIDVSAGWPGGAVVTVPPASVPPGCFLEYARVVKEAVSVPVIGVGRITDHLLAQKALAEGQADLIAFARALLCDPEMPNKVRDGRPYEECDSCSGCHRLLHRGAKVRCIKKKAPGSP
jgi:2,4-dienoyl-CoA reductase-like NADH-dependent reductase (Old Yellow Enzyme family)